MAKVTITDAYGKQIEVEVKQDILNFMEENDRYINSQHDNDQRYFQLIHFDTAAWSNMKGLSACISAEDEYFGVQEEVEEIERAFYMERLAICQQLLPQVRDLCTATQWRRFMWYRAFGYTIREIAQKEGCRQYAVSKSIAAANKKISDFFIQRNLK